MLDFLKRKGSQSKFRRGLGLGSILPSTEVLLLIDWDNLFICLHERFKQEMRLDYRIQKLLDWIKIELGELLGGFGFVFAPEHLNVFHQEFCVKNRLRLITCPKRKLEEPKRNPKTGSMETEQDTVDETLAWFGELMIKHPDVKYICLVSGDDDYVPFIKTASDRGIKIALAPPTLDSLSRSKKLIRLACEHPNTQQKMIFRLDAI